MDTSTYQLLKIHILNFLDISRDAVHIHIGLVVFFLAVVLWKKGRIELACLMPVFLVAMGMEAFDLRDDLRSFGHFRWSASLHDLINTTIWPVAIVVMSKANVFRPAG